LLGQTAPLKRVTRALVRLQRLQQSVASAVAQVLVYVNERRLYVLEASPNGAFIRNSADGRVQQHL
jgi:hypothetical protein